MRIPHTPPASCLGIALLAAVLPLRAEIWPQTFGSFQRVSTAGVQLQDAALWNESGYKDGESAQYASGARKFSATAWRMLDSTGALAAFDWMRPPDATPSSLSSLAVETKTSVLLAHGNYVFRFEGYKPQPLEIASLIEGLPNVDGSPLPSLIGYLPDQGLVPNSGRYVIGPEGLSKFAPGIPPSVAAFHLGAEGQIGTFQAPGGNVRLAIFEYPTHQIAMARVEAFRTIPGAMVKRSGPLIAVVLAPPNPDAAERLLSLVRYEAQVTMSERVPTRRDNIANLILNAFLLIGILLAFCAVAGLAFGGVRVMMRRGARGEAGEPMILLHLEDR